MIEAVVKLKRPAVPSGRLRDAVIPWVVWRAGGRWHPLEPSASWVDAVLDPLPIELEYVHFGEAGDVLDVSYPTAWDKRRLFRFELVDGRLKHVDEGEDHDALVLREAGITWPV